jgi:predicted enzyme related to lactoylglutathione lyase
MRIYLMSVMVDDQEKALDFYTHKLGFVKKTEVPLGEYKWLTLTAPEGAEGMEVLLEPNANPAAKTFQQAMYASGIPIASFASNDIHAEHARLEKVGVRFTMPPTNMGPVTIAVFDDTCGNLIQLAQLA